MGDGEDEEGEGKKDRDGDDANIYLEVEGGREEKGRDEGRGGGVLFTLS